MKILAAIGCVALCACTSPVRNQADMLGQTFVVYQGELSLTATVTRASAEDPRVLYCQYVAIHYPWSWSQVLIQKDQEPLSPAYTVTAETPSGKRTETFRPECVFRENVRHWIIKPDSENFSITLGPRADK